MAESVRIPSGQAPQWADPLPTFEYGSGGVITVSCSEHIAAPPATCLEIMLDTSSYAGWNKWIPRATITKTPASEDATKPVPAALAHLAGRPECLTKVGTEFDLEVHLNPASASHRITSETFHILEEFERDGRRGLRVGWKTTGDAWYLKAERIQEFLETADGKGCDYSNWETFFGPVAYILKMAAGSALLAGFQLWVGGLKEAAEAKAKSA